MTTTQTALRPASEAEVEEAVREARGRHEDLDISGGGTKRGLGRPAVAATPLSLAGLSGVTLYEPSEMVIGAHAGTPLSVIEATLAQRGQRLPFEPPRLSALYGSGGEPSIGAVAACNLSGPRRINAGSARDGLIGVRAVTGRGETIKSGGRVMKNVTGYDLVKLLAGSHGTLGVLTEVTFKVLPAPETEATLVVEGLEDRRAVACLSAGLTSPWEVTGAAHLPGDPARTLLRIEGFERQVAYRSTALAEALSGFGAATVVTGEASAALWEPLREPAFEASRAVWRVSVTPSHGPDVAAAIRAGTDAEIRYDWGGGLLWVGVEAGHDAGAGAIRAALAGRGGHATLMRAPDEIRARVDVFEPQPEAIMALTRRIKESFDPDGVLNPGRMYAGV